MTIRSWLRTATAAALLMAPLAAQAKDELVIGVSQFPSSMHPGIDPEVIKSYTLSFALRPTTAFLPDGPNTCIACTELPTLQNGLVRIEQQANGKPGIHHVLSRVFKDVILRYQTMRGRHVPRRSGWDTHGLPIELKVLQALPDAERRGLDTLGLRAKAREYALDQVDKQREQFKR